MNSKDDFYNFICAIKENRFEDIIIFLKNANSFVNEKTEDGKTAILTACSTENIDINIIKLLITYGADINETSDKGDTCLSEACKNGNKELVIFLLENNCNVNVKSERKYIHECNYLHILARGNGCDLLNLIMTHANSKNINLNIQDKRGFSPLMVAVEEGNINIAKLFIKYGADVNIISWNSKYSGKTSVLHLSFCKDIEFFEQLFDLVNFKIVEKLAFSNNNLIERMLTSIKFWYKPNKINVLIKILNHPKILPILKNAEDVYLLFFNYLRGSGITVNDFEIVVSRFLELHLPFQTEDFLNILIINCTGNLNLTITFRKLLDSFVRVGGLNVDNEMILQETLIYSPDIIFDIMKYCIKYNHLFIIEHIISNNYHRLKYSTIIDLFNYSTPSVLQVKRLCNPKYPFLCNNNHGGDGDVKQYKNYLENFYRFPSLLELSRDTIRNYIGNFLLRNSKEYIEFMDKLTISKCYYDILTLRMPIYCSSIN